ncbi:MAG TPA: hypothetical protein PLR88_05465, partial [Bacteroidales bacterium]|nr:hypothetical protein [Bacteroidales bacterium]
MKHSLKRILTCGVASVYLLAGVSGQNIEKKQYRATQVSTPPVIDGTLDEDAWQSGTWIDDFTQYEPYNGKPS